MVSPQLFAVIEKFVCWQMEHDYQVILDEEVVTIDFKYSLCCCKNCMNTKLLDISVSFVNAIMYGFECLARYASLRLMTPEIYVADFCCAALLLWLPVLPEV